MFQLRDATIARGSHSRFDKFDTFDEAPMNHLGGSNRLVILW